MKFMKILHLNFSIKSIIKFWFIILTYDNVMLILNLDLKHFCRKYQKGITLPLWYRPHKFFLRFRYVILNVAVPCPVWTQRSCLEGLAPSIKVMLPSSVCNFQSSLKGREIVEDHVRSLRNQAQYMTSVIYCVMVLRTIIFLRLLYFHHEY